MNYSIYFSPTGGTKKVADILASHLEGTYKEVDLGKEIDEMVLEKEDICLVSVPSFGGRVPQICVDRLRNVKGNGARVILNCVYGNRHWDDTLTELQDVMESMNFVCVAALATVAEHSIFRQFATGRPDANDVVQLIEFAKQIQEKLNRTEDTKLELEGNHDTYKEYHGTPFKPMGNEQCIACGICAKECPVHAIDDTKPQITDQEKCISCMHCISICPVQARGLDADMLKAVGEKMAPALGGYKNNYLYL